MEELLAATKLNDLLHRKQEEKQKNVLLWVLAVIGAVAVVAGIAYAVYRYFTPDYLDDLDEEFDEELADEFFEEEGAGSEEVIV